MEEHVQNSVDDGLDADRRDVATLVAEEGLCESWGRNAAEGVDGGRDDAEVKAGGEGVAAGEDVGDCGGVGGR